MKKLFTDLSATLAVLLLLTASGVYQAEETPLVWSSVEEAYPGTPITIALALPRNQSERPLQEGEALSQKAVLRTEEGVALGKAPFFHLDYKNDWSIGIAVLALPSSAGEGSAYISIEGLSKSPPKLPLRILPREYLFEEMILDERNTSIRVDPDPRKTAESMELWDVLTTVGTEFHGGGPFLLPIQKNRRTSHFGDIRIYRYSDGSFERSIHNGIDFGVPLGTPVFSCASGRVVLAKERIVTGFTVVIEHLPGVFSLYYHLDNLDVMKGAMVSEGGIIGSSGSTGLSTGPHLHWELRVHGEAADPDAFINNAVLDKDFILGRIDRLISVMH